jgi:hypothetical protein
MQNPYSAPRPADGTPAAGADGLRSIGDRFTQHKGFLSSKAYQGRLYANGDYIALCGIKDLSAQGQAAVFGLIGMLVYYLFRRKKPVVDTAVLPPGLVEQLEMDRLSPITVTVLRKADGIGITTSAISGIRIVGPGVKYSIGNGLLGGKKLKADLAELGYLAA